MNELSKLEAALAKLEAEKAKAEQYRHEHSHEIDAQKEKQRQFDERLAKLSQPERRRVLDEAGLQHISAAPPPISPIKSGAYVSTHMTSKTANLPKWREWKHTPIVQIWQACALSLNIDPQKLEDSGHSWMSDSNDAPSFKSTCFQNCEVESEYYLRVRLLVANSSERKYFSPSTLNIGCAWQSCVRLSEFAHWASSIVEWERLPPELVALSNQNTQEKRANSASSSKKVEVVASNDNPKVDAKAYSKSAITKRREELDLTKERGARRRILENWNDIKIEYGDFPDARQVLFFLKRDQDEKQPAKKTVQNILCDLRRKKLIP